MFDRLTQLPGREVVFWLVLLTAVFNFTPALFDGESIEAEPIWRKGLKDIPVALLLATALVLRLREAPRGDGGLRELLERPFRGTPISPLMWTAILLLGLYMAVDFLVRRPPELEFLASARYYVGYPLVAWAVWALALPAGALRRVVAVVAGLAALQGVLAILEFSGVTPDTFYANYVILIHWIYPRAIGTLGNPNNLALFLALPAILLIAGALGRGWWRWLLLALIFVGMAMTFSKAVGLAMVVALGVIALTGRAAGHADPRALLPLGALALGLTALSAAGRFGSGSLLDRTEAAKQAWDRWTGSLEDFFFGDGFGSLVSATGGEVQSQAIDNMILALGVEGGSLALVLFGLVAVSAFVCAARARHGKSGDALALGIQAYLVFFLLYSPFVVNFRLFPGALFYWVGVGLLLSSVLPASREPDRSSSPA